MNSQEDVDISKFRTDRPWRAAVDVPSHPTLRLVALTYVFAGLCHLWLADAWQVEWIPGNIFFFIGLVILIVRPCALAWAMCAVGKLLPLLFARDHLTQSLLLMVFATGGTLFLGLRAYLATCPGRLKRRTTSYGEISPHLLAFFDLLKLTTIATYLLAAFHKINRDFFDPDVSCAVLGLDKLADHYSTTLPAIPENWFLATAVGVIVLEASIGLLYILRRRRLALIAALIFHIPLTLTVAPAFAFVMLAGHAAFLRPADLSVFKDFLRRRGPAVAAAATATTALSLLLGTIPFGQHSMIPREWILWALLFTALFARPWHPETSQGRATCQAARPFLRRALHPRAIAWTMALVFTLHGLTPYLGIRFQHTAAMVSNLRIDEGCHNHLVMPESLRLRDDYIRIDEAYFVEPGHLPKYEAITTEQLWNGPMIRQMQINWCRDNLRPFYMSGTFRDRSFQIEDLCAEDLQWPFADDGIFGRQLFADHLRFQRNLQRECPQKCIH